MAPFSAEASSPCRTCGACCAYSREWPRFSTEDEAALARIPAQYADHNRGRMRCAGERCTALAGTIGVSTSCEVYSVRPEVCRTCQPGDDACQLARTWFGLVPLSRSSFAQAQHEDGNRAPDAEPEALTYRYWGNDRRRAPGTRGDPTI
jgi:Fe-S-cluster containining protein